MSKLTPDLPQADVICNRAKTAKQFLEEESDKSTFPSTAGMFLVLLKPPNIVQNKAQ